MNQRVYNKMLKWSKQGKAGFLNWRSDLKDDQCDQKKIAKCLQKLPKNDFTRKRIDFDTSYINCLRMWVIWAN